MFFFFFLNDPVFFFSSPSKRGDIYFSESPASIRQGFFERIDPVSL